MANYDSKTSAGKCVFSEIGTGRILPTGESIIYDDENYLGFLSPFPNTPGFAVLMPKQHFGSDVLAMPDSDLQDFILVAKKLSAHLIDSFPDVGRVGLIMEGTGVDHAHIKLVPLHGTGHMKHGEWKQYLSTEEAFFETYAGFISSHDGPKADIEELRKLAERLRI